MGWSIKPLPSRCCAHNFMGRSKRGHRRLGSQFRCFCRLGKPVNAAKRVEYVGGRQLYRHNGVGWLGKYSRAD